MNPNQTTLKTKRNEYGSAAALGEQELQGGDSKLMGEKNPERGSKALQWNSWQDSLGTSQSVPQQEPLGVLSPFTAICMQASRTLGLRIQIFLFE